MFNRINYNRISLTLLIIFKIFFLESLYSLEKKSIKVDWERLNKYDYWTRERGYKQKSMVYELAFNYAIGLLDKIKDKPSLFIQDVNKPDAVDYRYSAFSVMIDLENSYSLSDIVLYNKNVMYSVHAQSITGLKWTLRNNGVKINDGEENVAIKKLYKIILNQMKYFSDKNKLKLDIYFNSDYMIFYGPNSSPMNSPEIISILNFDNFYFYVRMYEDIHYGLRLVYGFTKKNYYKKSFQKVNINELDNYFNKLKIKKSMPRDK